MKKQITSLEEIKNTVRENAPIFFTPSKHLGSKSGYRIYVDTLKDAKVWLIELANMDLIYWTVPSSSRRGEEWGKEGGCGVITASINLSECMKIWCNFQVIVY